MASAPSSVQDLAFDADGNLLVAVKSTQPLFRQTHDLSFSPIGNTLIPYLNGFNDPASVASSPMTRTWWWSRPASTASFGLIMVGAVGRQRQRPALLASRIRAWSSDQHTRLSGVAIVVPARRTLSLGRRRGGPSRASLACRSRDCRRCGQSQRALRGHLQQLSWPFQVDRRRQTLQNLGQPGLFSAIAVDSRNSQVVYAGECFGQVIRSLDGGQTFAPASTGLAGAGVHGLAQDSRARSSSGCEGAACSRATTAPLAGNRSTPARRCSAQASRPARLTRG